jgi:hypothetical protein
MSFMGAFLAALTLPDGRGGHSLENSRTVIHLQWHVRAATVREREQRRTKPLPDRSLTVAARTFAAELRMVI